MHWHTKQNMNYRFVQKTARNIFVTSCEGEEVSRVAGYDKERMVKRITFENIVRDGRRAESFADAKIDVGSFAEEIAIR